MRKELLMAVVLAGAASFASRAEAAVPAISYSYVTDQSSYSTTPGGSVVVLIYLKETLSGGASSLIDSDDGLISGGFSVTQSSTGLPANPAGIYSILGSTTSNGSNFSGGAFTEKNTDATNNTYATFRAGDNIANPNSSTGPETSSSSATGMIEIGSVTIEGGTSVGTTTFTLGNFAYPSTNKGGYTQTLGSDYDLDYSTGGGTSDPSDVTTAGGSAGAETFTVAVTPEPASLSLGVLGAVGILIRRSRRNTAAGITA